MIFTAEDREWIIEQFNAHKPVEHTLWTGSTFASGPPWVRCSCGWQGSGTKGGEPLEPIWDAHIDDEWARFEDWLIEKFTGTGHPWCEGAGVPHRFSNEQKPDRCDTCSFSPDEAFRHRGRL